MFILWIREKARGGAFFMGSGGRAFPGGGNTGAAVGPAGKRQQKG